MSLAAWLESVSNKFFEADLRLFFFRLCLLQEIGDMISVQTETPASQIAICPSAWTCARKGTGCASAHPGEPLFLGTQPLLVVFVTSWSNSF